jgi:hypothetical protein
MNASIISFRHGRHVLAGIPYRMMGVSGSVLMVQYHTATVLCHH